MLSIRTIAVLGLGTMGHGIAQAFAMAGYPVKCFDEAVSARRSLPDRIRSNLERLSAAELVQRADIPAILDRCVICSSEGEALGDVDFVTEAVAEDLAVKQQLFTRIEGLVKVDAILASNSSSYPMSQTAQRMRHPERAIVTHWFNPAHIVPVVEVVPGQKTAQSVVQATCDLMRQIGKTPIRINQELPGFLVNRVQIALMREVFDLLDRGIASAEEIDAAIQGSMGLRLAALGPLQIIDFAGLDITGKVYQNLVTDLRSDQLLPEKIQEMLNAGQFGTKTGAGFFRYTPETLKTKEAERDRRYLELVKLLHHRALD